MSYLAQRAIIMAAGYGKRLMSLTDNVPKPLIKVRGKSFIIGIVEALMANGINDICLVVGYKKELFYEELSNYTNVRFIDNPYYDRYNNIYSLYLAREELGKVDTVIMDADQIIRDISILSPRFERSGYSVIYSKDYTKEWILELDDAGIVKSCSRTGGNDGYALYSVSFWSVADGQKLARHLNLAVADERNHQLYWDDVALFLYPEEYQLGVREISADSLVEIDTLEELVEYDDSYADYLDSVNGN